MGRSALGGPSLDQPDRIDSGAMKPSNIGVPSIVIAVALSLVILQEPYAAPKGKLVGFIAEYEELKETALKTLSGVDEARRQGYSSDPQEILNVYSRLAQLLREITEYSSKRNKESISLDPKPEDELRTIYAVLTATQALTESVKAELNYQLGAKWPFTTTLRAKHEDILRFADEELRKQAGR